MSHRYSNQKAKIRSTSQIKFHWLNASQGSTDLDRTNWELQDLTKTTKNRTDWDWHRILPKKSDNLGLGPAKNSEPLAGPYGTVCPRIRKNETLDQAEPVQKTIETSDRTRIKNIRNFNFEILGRIGRLIPGPGGPLASDENDINESTKSILSSI